MNSMIQLLIGNNDFIGFECRKNFLVIRYSNRCSQDYSYETMNKLYKEMRDESKDTKRKSFRLP